jgi:cysteine-rich repeat protein
MRLVGLIAVLVVVPAAHAWQVPVSGTPPDARPSAVAVDAAGDVVAAGRAINAGGDEDAMVVKLAAENGLELWRRQTAGSGGADDLYRAVAVGAGGVVAVGRVSSVNAEGDALMTRYTPTGSLAWQVTFDGEGGAEDEAFAVVLDAAEDALVAGESTPAAAAGTRYTVWKRQASDGASVWATSLAGDGGTARAIALAGGDVVAAGDVGPLMVVARFDGTNGAEVWRTDVAGSGDANDVAGAIAVGGGRVVVAGRLVRAGGDRDFAVVALDATTGTEQWRVVIDGTATGEADLDDGLGVAVDAAGDVLAVGRLSNADTDDDAVAVKLAGADGAELWRTVLDGSNSNDDVYQAVALDAAGDLLVAGTIRNRGTRADFLVGKLANATGAEVWRRELDGPEHGADTGAAVAVGPTGDLVAAGRLRNFLEDGFVVTRRVGAHGGDFPCGDGVPNPGEQCDDGNASAGDGCRGDCTLEVCGDGIPDPQEQCDDGNFVGGDCCSDACTVEADGSPCDDADACTLLDACVAGVCTASGRVTCIAASPCHLALCDPADGSCSSPPKAEGAACNDGNACTVVDQCIAAVCTGMTPIQCNDAEPCTSDGCAPALGCVFTPLEGFDSITCIFQRPDIANACGAGIPRSIDRRVRAAKGRIARASLTQQPSRARRVLKGATMQLEKALRLVEAQRRRGVLDVTCAAVLESELGEAAAHARDVREQLASR